jgi:hypothetical protein
MDFDAELRTLVNKVRDPTQAPVAACFEAGNPFKLKFGPGKSTISEGMLLPVSYMVGFWRRRTAEGTSDIAEFLLAAGVRRLN